MAGKDNAIESEIDKTSFFWTGQCGVCHPGGGPGERDRDDELYYDVATGELGYEKLGKTAFDVVLDGDYALLNPSDTLLSPAAWNVTGVSEPDCLLCHRADRTVVSKADQNSFWRQVTLRSMAALVDDAAGSVPAYAAAPTAAQGWWSTLDLAPALPGKPPVAAVLQIDYGVGLALGDLKGKAGALVLDGDLVAATPRDYACWGCHAVPDLKKRGRVWFDPDQDVHYAGFNRLHDADLSNDVPDVESVACTRCHPADVSHDFSKGNAFVGSVRNDTDYVDFQTCRDCHLATSPLKDPEAPAPTGTIHQFPGHLETLSCQLCHIPYKLDAADLVVDNATTGKTIGYKTDELLSADPLDPTHPVKDRWWPSIHWKTDKDGAERLFPAKGLNTVWWGDWDQNGTPMDLSDDVIEPITLWRLRQMTGGAPLPGTTDDNGDGKVEVNRPDEILLYLVELRTYFDSYGTVLAERPVLIKGGAVWHEDVDAEAGVDHFEYHGTGIKVESFVPFALDHNVLPVAEAIGDCAACHSVFSGYQPTPVFDRAVLVDPFGPDGDPVYETPRDQTGIILF